MLFHPVSLIIIQTTQRLFRERRVTNRIFKIIKMGPKKTAAAAKAPIDISEPPKKPRSGYIIFTMEKRPEVVKENPGMKVTQIMKHLGSLWRELDDGEKSKYGKMAETEKAQYQDKVDAFVAAGGDLKAKPKKASKSTKETAAKQEEEEESESE